MTRQSYFVLEKEPKNLKMNYQAPVVRSSSHYILTLISYCYKQKSVQMASPFRNRRFSLSLMYGTSVVQCVQESFN